MNPSLEPGRVYRTQHFARWDSNPTRLVNRLVRQGHLSRLRQGLYHCPIRSRFGEVPPDDDAVLQAFLDGTPYVVTGPERWNALQLGTTALHAWPLVYNTKVSGEHQLGNRRFRFRRAAFPADPSPEWFVVDLLRNLDSVGGDLAEVADRLKQRVQAGFLNRDALWEAARDYGRRAEQAVVRRALR